MITAALLALLPFVRVMADSSVTTEQPTDATQTRVTLQAAFADGSTQNGFQYKYGTIPSVGDFFKYLATATCDPLTITQGSTSWNYVAKQKWVESPSSDASTLNAEFSTTVTLTEETTISFDWQVNSEENIGMLQFYVDGTAVKSITGVTDFATVKYSLRAGSHTLKWAYSRSSAENTGQGIGRIKNLDVQNTTAGTWINAPATGSSLRLTALYPSQQYLFRAYSKVGGDTVYSDIKQFETTSVSIGKPTVTTTQTTATLTGTVNPGDAEVETGYIVCDARTTFEDALLTSSSDNIPITLSSTGYWYSSSYGYVYNTTKSDNRSFSTTFTLSEPTTISFEYKVSGGGIHFYVDGSQTNLTSTSYTTVTRTLAAGTHTLKWESYYSTSYSTYAAYVRNLEVKNTEYANKELQKYVVQPDGNTLSQIAEGLKPNTTYCLYSYMKPTFDSPLEKRWPLEQSEIISFTTKDVSVQTDSVTNLMQASATLNGSFDGGDATIAANGIQYRNAAGTRWSNVTPTTDGNKLTGSIRNLRPATAYQWRTYLQAQDCDTVFSSINTFTTVAVEALTPTLASVTQTTAHIRGKVEIGDASIYASGMEFKAKTSTEWESTEELDADGTYHIDKNNLNVNTAYVVRTYVQAAGADMVYSDVLEFTTLNVQASTPTLTNVTQTTATLTSKVDVGEVSVKSGFEMVSSQYDGVRSAFENALFLSESDYIPVTGDIYIPTTSSSTSSEGLPAKLQIVYWCAENGYVYNTTSTNGKSFSTTFTLSEPTVVSFEYKVSGGRINFYVDGVQTNLTNTSYTTVNRPLAAGTHTLKWESYYSTSYSTYAAYVRNLKIKNTEYEKCKVLGNYPTQISGDSLKYIFSGLKPNETYFVRSYVQAQDCDTIYSTITSFTTKAVTVNADSTTNIRQISAMLNGTVAAGDAPVVAKGIQYRKSADTQWSNANTTNVDNKLTANISILRPNTEYVWRTFVKVQDCDTIYSSVASFTTMAVETQAPTLESVTQTTATLISKVNVGNANVKSGLEFLSGNPVMITRTTFENALLSSESDSIPVTGDISNNSTSSGGLASSSFSLIGGSSSSSSSAYWYAGNGYVYNTTKSDYKSFSTTFTLSEPTTISFEYKVSGGGIHFYVDGSQTNLTSTSYTTVTRTLAAGTHTLKWESYYTGTYSAYVRNLEVKNTEYAVKILDRYSVPISGDSLKYTFSGLKPNTTYYVRSYVQAQNCDTVYSSLASFTTKPVTVKADSTMNIGQVSATLNGTLDTGDATVVAKGIQYRKKADTQWSDTKVTTTGNKLTANLSGLLPVTSYQWRAFVQAQDCDTVYSPVMEFATLSFFENCGVNNITQTSVGLSAKLASTNEKGVTYYFKNTMGDIVAGTTDAGTLSGNIMGLAPNTSYTYYAVAKTADGKECASEAITFKTSAVGVNISTSNVTQTSASVIVTFDTGTATINNMQYRLGYYGSWQTLTDGKARLTGLSPNTSYTVYLQWTVNGSTYSNSISFMTESVELYAGWVSAEQTSALFTMGSYTVGTATWKASGIVFRDETYHLIKGETFRLTGLNHGVKYRYTYFVETLEGGRIEKTGYFRTKSITTVTSPATSISNRSATLNGMIECDAYSGAEFGFQWKTKQNWTTDPRFTKGRKNDDGTISVSLVNGMLNPDTEYQFRTAVRYGKYSDDTDVYYYGEWRDFRTESEFVIYPATPYTMYRTDSENNRLVLCGYYVAGSEDVVSQGYEYWRGGSANAKGVASSYATAAEKNVITTDGSMEASIDLSTLDAGTYMVQAFVKTATATYYGQQLSFSVGTPDAIEGVYGEEPVCMTSHNAIVLRNAENLHVRIADMAGRTLYSGRCESNMETYSVPGGIYIVQFGAGHSKKVLVK